MSGEEVYPHCFNGTDHCACEITKQTGVCCFCRRNIPPLHAGITKEAPVKQKLPVKKKEGRDMTLMEELLGLDLNRVDFDDMVGLLAYGTIVVATYKENDLEVPDRLTENVKALKTEINRRATDNREAALRTIEQEEERLKTTTERKADLAEQKAALLKKLGRG